MDNKPNPAPRRIPTDVAGVIALTAANLGFFAGILVLFLAARLTSGLTQWLSPYLTTAMGAIAATHPVVGLLLSLLLCGVLGTILIGVVRAAFRVGVTVYRKTAALLLRWHS